VISWIECIPNVSEGRDDKIILALSQLLSSHQNVRLLHIDQGWSANRTVFTFLVDKNSLIEVGAQFMKLANQLIDMSKQTGAHPRVGAVDVFPMVALEKKDEGKLLDLSKILAEKVSKELSLPIYLYEKSQPKPYRKRLEQIRKGGYEAFFKKIKLPEWRPDFGPSNIQKESGVTVIGVRDILIAVNFSLNTKNISIAKNIAERIRTTGVSRNGEHYPGVFSHLKAIGWFMSEYECAQVSTNITNYKSTQLHKVFETINIIAKEHNCKIHETELIGMIPEDALLSAGEYFASNNLTKVALIDKAIESLKLTKTMNGNVRERLLDLNIST